MVRITTFPRISECNLCLHVGTAPTIWRIRVGYHSNCWHSARIVRIHVQAFLECFGRCMLFCSWTCLMLWVTRVRTYQVAVSGLRSCASKEKPIYVTCSNFGHTGVSIERGLTCDSWSASDVAAGRSTSPQAMVRAGNSTAAARWRGVNMYIPGIAQLFVCFAVAASPLLVVANSLTRYVLY